MPTLTVYFIFNVFLFIVSGYVFIKTTPDLMKKKEFIIFRYFIIVFQVYLAASTIWTMQEFDIIKLPRAVFSIVLFISLISTLLNAMLFYRFVMVYFEYSDTEGKKPIYKIVASIPFLATCGILFSSIWSGLVFSINEEAKLIKGPMYFISYICASIYFTVILVSSIVEWIRARSPQTKKNCLTIFSTIIFLVAWLMVDNIFEEGITIIPIAVFTIILVLFVTFQQSGINTDALTQMNNRRKAMEYLSDQLENVDTDSPLYLYMCDINYFKKINDTYGHIEGDKALKILAGAIKETAGKYGGFAARYGGDEFIVAMKVSDKNYDKDVLMNRINTKVKNKCESLNKPYTITLSYGCVRCDNSKKNYEFYLKAADDVLYEAKKSR